MLVQIAMESRIEKMGCSSRNKLQNFDNTFSFIETFTLNVRIVCVEEWT